MRQNPLSTPTTIREDLQRRPVITPHKAGRIVGLRSYARDDEGRDDAATRILLPFA